jgi:hypothetical protein
MAIQGKDGKVTLGAHKIVGIGNWSLDGIQAEEFDASEFGDNWKKFLYGMKDGGTISFAGHYEPADHTGQQALQQANLYNSAITNLRLYLDNTSYWEPCQSAGYFSPQLTTGAPTHVSNVRVTAFNVGLDKSGLATVSFTAKVSGVMVLI